MKQVGAMHSGGAVAAFAASHPQPVPLPMTPCQGSKLAAHLVIAQTQAPAPVRIAGTAHIRHAPIAAKPSRKSAKPAFGLVQV
jgi:hypothetical protein